MKKLFTVLSAALAFGLAFGSAQAADGKAVSQELGCSACHAAKQQLVGPSWQAIAKRYKGDQAKILERIKSNVNEGGSGNWTEATGGVPMPPQPQAQGKPKKQKAIASWAAGMAK